MTLRNATKEFRIRVRTLGLRTSALYAIFALCEGVCVRGGGLVRVQTPERREIAQKVLYEKDAQKP